MLYPFLIATCIFSKASLTTSLGLASTGSSGRIHSKCTFLSYNLRAAANQSPHAVLPPTASTLTVSRKMGISLQHPGVRPLTTLSAAGDEETESLSYSVSIQYCTGCRWMLRAAWMAQELLSTFEDDLDSVSLLPSRPPAPGGRFVVKLNDKVMWDRAEEGRFPESKELKRLIRNEIDPGRDLGHVDGHEAATSGKPSIQEMDDDEAKELRRQFGVM